MAVRTMIMAMVSLSAQVLFAQAHKPMTPASPGTSGDPTWQGTLRSSDGRTFVTDGALVIDAAFAKPTRLPDREIPPKVLDDYFKAPQTDECRFDDLTRVATGTTYQTPSGIALSSTYIDYLRRSLPTRSVRFRMTAPRRPVLIEANGKLIGVLMPVAQ